jgi:hypothetical protein
MKALLPLRAAAALLGCRDPRTARARIDMLGVPVVDLGTPGRSRVFVRPVDIHRAIAAATRVTCAGTPPPGGVDLPPGVKLGTAAAREHLERSLPGAYGRAVANQTRGGR